MYVTKARIYLIIGALLLSVLLIAGCTPTQAPPVVEKVVETVIVTVVVEPTPMPTDVPPPPPDHSDIMLTTDFWGRINPERKN